ncbi:MAG: slipin family protein [Acidobacteriota bacterium]
MLFIRRFDIHEHDRGLLFRKGIFQRVLAPGVHWCWDPTYQLRLERVSVRDSYLLHDDLNLIVKSGTLDPNEVVVHDLADHQRLLVWRNGRFETVLNADLWVLWNVTDEVRTEVCDVRDVRFQHAEIQKIVRDPAASHWFETIRVEDGTIAVLHRDGRRFDTLEPGLHVLWKNQGQYQCRHIKLREQVLDVSGQEIMTADRVTLRLNAVVVYRVVRPLEAIDTVDDFAQTLYRDAQLVLRAVVGSRELDSLLEDKDSVAAELQGQLVERAVPGLEILRLGIRDLILPGDMKTLMNRVIEARQAAEANLIARREETAAMRSQANTARLLDNNPTLMKLRELEVLETVAAKGSLKIVLGEQGLSDRLMKLV